MHVVRMSKGCQNMALTLGYSVDFAELILHSSPMHDVGKNWCSRSYPPQARQIERRYEKWDDSGYSMGLVGEAIPIEGRIAAICDVV